MSKPKREILTVQAFFPGGEMKVMPPSQLRVEQVGSIVAMEEGSRTPIAGGVYQIQGTEEDVYQWLDLQGRVFILVLFDDNKGMQEYIRSDK